jgi:diguanylate cyclase (GGDEF)-like protein
MAAGLSALVATCVLIAVTYVGARQRSQTQQIVARESEITALYQQAKSSAITQGAAGLSYFVLGDERFVADLDVAKDQLGASLATLAVDARSVGSEEVAQVRDLQAKYEPLAENVGEFLAAVDAGEREAALQLAADRNVDGQFRVLIEDLNVATANAQARLRRAQENDAATQRRWTAIVTVVAVAWAGATLLSTAAFLRWVARPVVRVADAAHALAAGELAARVDRGGLREIDELAAAFNAMAARVEESTAQLRQAAATDGLTGLLNHGALMEALDREVERSLRYQHPLAVMMMDVDGFKQVNDEYGHPAGDAVLERVGEVLRSSTRQTDVVGRYGGDEFMAILPETGRERAVEAAQRLLDTFSSTRLRVEGGEEVAPMMSLGLAVFPEDGTDKRGLLAFADTALYEAKRNGGNSLHPAPPRAVA